MDDARTIIDRFALRPHLEGGFTVKFTVIPAPTVSAAR